MVPLNPIAGDCYILATHPLREGELSLLARDLAQARDVGSLLRIATSGDSDTGRVAIAALAGEHEVEIPPAAALDEEEPAEYGPLELDPIEPAGKEAAARDADAALEASGFEAPGAGKVAEDAASAIDEEAGSNPEHTADSEDGIDSEGSADAPGRGRAEVGLPLPPSFAERRPWYEWIALWEAGRSPSSRSRSSCARSCPEFSERSARRSSSPRCRSAPAEIWTSSRILPAPP